MRERAQHQQHHAPCRAASASARRTASSGSLDVTSVTTRPMNTGIIESSSATTKPATNSADEQALRLAREMPIERRSAPPAAPGLADGGRLQQPFKEGEHDSSHKGASHRPVAKTAAGAPFIYGRNGARFRRDSCPGQGGRWFAPF